MPRVVGRITAWHRQHRTSSAASPRVADTPPKIARANGARERSDCAGIPQSPASRDSSEADDAPEAEAEAEAGDAPKRETRREPRR